MKAESVLWRKARQQKHKVAGHTAYRVGNQRASNVGIHPFSCSPFPSVWDPTQWIDPTHIHQECFSSAKLLWKHCQKHVQGCVCFLIGSNPSQIDWEDETYRLSMNQDKVSDDNFYFAMYLVEFLDYGYKKQPGWNMLIN